MAGLVVGDDALLLVGDQLALLEAGDHAVERVVEVDGRDPVASRRGRRRSRPHWRGSPGRRRSAPTSGARSRAGRRRRRAASRGCARPGSARGRAGRGASTFTCRSNRPGRSSAGSRSSRRFDAPITTSRWLSSNPSSSTSSWFSVWLCSWDDGPPTAWPPTASSSSMKMIAGWFLRAVGEQAPDAGRADADEHLDERRGALRSRTSRPTRGRSPWPGASCRCPAGRTAAPRVGTRAPSFSNRPGWRRNSTTSSSSARTSSTPATSSHRTAECRSRASIVDQASWSGSPQQPPADVDKQREQDEDDPRDREAGATRP